MGVPSTVTRVTLSSQRPWEVCKDQWDPFFIDAEDVEKLNDFCEAMRSVPGRAAIRAQAS